MFADGREWVVVAVSTAEEAIEEVRPTKRAGEASRIAAATGATWRDTYWKATIRRQNGTGIRVVDSIDAAMQKMSVVQGHIEV